MNKPKIDREIYKDQPNPKDIRRTRMSKNNQCRNYQRQEKAKNNHKQRVLEKIQNNNWHDDD